MDAAAQLAIESLLVGLHEAKVLSADQLGTVLRAIEDAGASAGWNIPAVEEDLDTLVGTVRHLTGAYPRPGPQNSS